MFSPGDDTLEKLIKAKRIELESEKLRLNIAAVEETNELLTPEDQQSAVECERRESEREATLEEPRSHDNTQACPDSRLMGRFGHGHSMLKTGEFSPNNPLMRANGLGHELFPGLGAYEEQSGSLRRQRQQQYRLFLDQQSKKTPLKEESELTPRRSRTSESSTQYDSDLRATSPDNSTADNAAPSSRVLSELAREKSSLEKSHPPARDKSCSTGLESSSPGGVDKGCGGRRGGSGDGRNMSGKRDAATQCEVVSTAPASRAVQTDNMEIEEVSWKRSCLTEAERELSPRRAGRTDNAHHEEERSRTGAGGAGGYQASFLDAETIRRRNLRAQQEAAERRRFYQEELRNQIAEQRRIREERRAREKMLEEAETRRLEEQLRSLRAQPDTRPAGKVNVNALRKSYENLDQKKVTSYHRPVKKSDHKQTKSENSQQKQQKPLYNSTHYFNRNDKTYSSNIPDNSLFSPSCDLENYLRRNLNPKPFAERLNYVRSDYVPSFLRKDIADMIVPDEQDDPLPIPVLRHSPQNLMKKSFSDHGGRTGRTSTLRDRAPTEFGESSTDLASINSNLGKTTSHLGIPGSKNSNPLRKSTPVGVNSSGAAGVSEAMRRVQDKWEVPAVQKTSVRSGAGSNILTQLGSIRRQLQLEQLKLDSMLTNTK